MRARSLSVTSEREPHSNGRAPIGPEKNLDDLLFKKSPAYNKVDRLGWDDQDGWKPDGSGWGAMILMRVEAIIQPERLERLRAALEEKGFVSMTISEVMGRGEKRGIRLRYNGRGENSAPVPKARIELVVCDYEVDFLVETITEAIRTGNIGDGRIFVSPVARSIKIRSGEEMENFET